MAKGTRNTSKKKEDSMEEKNEKLNQGGTPKKEVTRRKSTP